MSILQLKKTEALKEPEELAQSRAACTWQTPG